MSRTAFRLIGIWAGVGGNVAAQPPLHPLDPASAAELSRGLALLQSAGALRGEVVVASLTAKEPPKASVLAGQAIPRQLAAIIFDPSLNRTTELTIDLASGQITDRRVVPGATPQHLARDNPDAAAILRADGRWRSLLSGRGRNPDSVSVFAYPIGAFGPARSADRLVIVRVDGVIAYLNLTKGQLYRLVDAGGLGPGDAESPFDPSTLVVSREPSRLKTETVGGPSYRRAGYAVSWDLWSFRIGLAPKEGLLLYQVTHGPAHAQRSVLYKAALAELWVPYGDRGQRDFFLNAFDVGEVGIARYGRPEMSAADCPAHAEFIPIAYLDQAANVVEVARGFCLYERDGGTAWRHGTDGRRQRQLVLSSVFRIDNYDYGVNWVFHQDGTLEAEVLLTGIMNARPADHAVVSTPIADTSYSTLVAPHVQAMHHQHFFNFRLDLDVVEPNHNTVVEMNSEAPPRGPANPHGNAIRQRETVLRSERLAGRDVDLKRHRFWRVLSGTAKNNLGQPVSYALWPGENAVPYALPDTRTLQRGGYAAHHLWVTPQADREQSPAGDYVYQSQGGDGLPTWTRQNRPIANRDVVLWYTLGITHIPRPEDWPVMPVHRAGFKLSPFGFHDRNPALDLPAPIEP